LKNVVDRNCCPLTMAPQAPQSDEAFDIMLPLFEVRWGAHVVCSRASRVFKKISE